MPRSPYHLNIGGWVSVRDAAHILNVDQATIARWDRQGHLAAAGVRVGRTLGGHRRFAETDLRELAARQTRQVGQGW
jgi:excisionase family DNA binding protein